MAQIITQSPSTLSVAETIYAVVARISDFANAFEARAKRAAQADQLLAMTDEQLRDVGLERMDLRTRTSTKIHLF